MPPARSNGALPGRSPAGGPGAAAPAITDEDWRRVFDTLAATARARDGDLAARKTELRRRMRALARAQRGQTG
jgi:hypothetical protein